MENVDGMIFDLLANDLHCSFVESAEYANLKELGSDQIVEGIVRCLWKCNPRTKTSIPSFGLPGNAVDRFRIASKISNEIKLLGIRDEQIGYQALLYPNVFDSRRIFLALFEKMPKEAANVEEERELTPLEKLKAEVGEMISRQMAAAAEHWVPEFCRFYQLQRIGRFWHPRRGAEGEMELAAGTSRGEEGIWTQIGGHFDGQEMEQQKPKIAPKPKLPPKPKLTLTKSVEEEKPPIKVKEEKFDERGNKEMMAKLEAKIAEKKAQILGKRSTLIELAQKIGWNVEEIEKGRQKVMGEEANDQRLLLLLEKPETSLEKLMNFVAEANTRRMALQEKFFAAKAERLEKLGEMGMGKGMGGNQQNEQRLAKLNEGIGAMEESTEEKRRIRAKLLKEWQKMGGEKERQKNEEGIESRNKFVRRILEISAMVAKQNEQIRKTANQVQSIRKEIDQLEGHLERTFTAINGWMASSGQRSNIGGNMEYPMKMQRIYKMLVRTHDQCGLVKESIQVQGQLSRQLDELTDRVELEAQKGVDGQLERVLNDLMLIRAENHELEGKLTAARRNEEEEEEIG